MYFHDQLDGEMWKKPFKPPLLSRTRPVDEEFEDRHVVDLTDSHNPYKKRRVLVHVVEESPTKAVPVAASKAAAITRKPLVPVINSIAAAKAVALPSDGQEGYYMVLWQVKTDLMSIAFISIDS